MGVKGGEMGVFGLAHGKNFHNCQIVGKRPIFESLPLKEAKDYY